MNYNKVILVGRIGNEPELKEKLGRFRLATSTKYQKNNEWHENTMWHNIVTFNENILMKMTTLEKGNLVLVEGEIEYKEYNEKWYTSIKAFKINLLQKREKTEQEKTKIVNVIEEDEKTPF